MAQEKDWIAQSEVVGLNLPAPNRKSGRRLAQRLGISSDFRFDYKDIDRLKYFVSDRGKIIPRRISGLTSRQQRSLTLAVKRARNIALMPYTRAAV